MGMQGMGDQAEAAMVDGSNIITGLSGVTTVNLQQGAIVLVGGTNVSIVEAPPKTFTFNASGGITSINGEVGPAIVINAGVGINVSVLAPSTVTVTNTGVISVSAGGPPASGAIALAAGTNISIVEGPPGTYTFNNTAPVTPAVTSINGDGTAAQVIAAGTGIGVVDAGATHTISSTLSNLQSGGDTGHSLITTAYTQTATVTIAAGKAGNYALVGSVIIPSIFGSESSACRLKVNGTVVATNAIMACGTVGTVTTNQCIQVSFLTALAVGDVVTLEAIQSGIGSPITTTANTKALQCLQVSV